MFGSTNWHSLSTDDKSSLVLQLTNTRKLLRQQAKTKSYKGTTTRKKKATKMNFANKELEQLFNDMPEEMKQFLGAR